MFNEDGEKICGRYTVSYEGYLFFGDNPEGLNLHDYDNWDEVNRLIDAYPEIEVEDNVYGVRWKNGEWY